MGFPGWQKCVPNARNHNPRVGGSSPSSATNVFNDLADHRAGHDGSNWEFSRENSLDLSNSGRTGARFQLKIPPGYKVCFAPDVGRAACAPTMPKSDAESASLGWQECWALPTVLTAADPSPDATCGYKSR